ncbi:MAG TPA: hypothetical protein PKH29_12640, partial [Oscillospiraceae bacterium]|nr:hypothetical protein [Oscillospiraceae bacterium]
MASLQKRQGMARKIIRRAVCSVCVVIMVFSAVMACSKLNAKAKILDDDTGLYSQTKQMQEPYITRVDGYKRNAKLYYASSDLGTFISQVNFDLVDQINADNNEIGLFTAQYKQLIKNLPKDTDHYMLRKIFATFDSQSLFDMWLASFQKATITPYLEQIRGLEWQMFGWYA